MKQWTEEQKQAINVRGKNVLVAAAAGSGKTAVLVERIIRLVLSGKTDIDRLLVVTFTNAAAEEMRLRIAEALEEAAKADPDDERIARQRILLSNASISTIHAFCQNVIRRNFTAVGLDPQFRLADEQETMLLKQDVLEAVLEEEYRMGTGDFLRFIADYSDEHGDDRIHDIITKIYSYAQSQPFPDAWLDRILASFAIRDEAELEQSDWLAELRILVRNRLREADDIIEYLIEHAPNLGGEAYLETFAEDQKLIKHLLDTEASGSWRQLQSAFLSKKYARLPAKGWAGDDNAKKYVKSVRDEAKKIIDDVQKHYFSQEISHILLDIENTEPVMREICRLVKKFAAQYQQLKLERTILDFNDLEHYAFDILRAEGTAEAPYKPSAVAQALRQKYSEVMVDEYQDTNPLQDAILSLVMREDTPSSFVVGDVKQSIYAFRMADSEIFQRKYDTYPVLGDKYQRVKLSRNFRSRASVLETINFIFRQVMVRESMELDYDDDAALYPGTEPALAEGKSLTSKVELDIIDMAASQSEDGETTDDELSGFGAEAVHIANRIKSLVRKENGEDSGILVYDENAEGKYRQLRWRDIVILLRSPKSKVNTLLTALKDQAIPAYASDDSGFFEEVEIKVILALLNIIDNARQDIPLAAVLFSPVGGFSAAELAEIRINVSDDDLYGALLRVNEPDSTLGKRLREKTAAFLSKLSGWRELAGQISVPELIWQLYRDTGYYDYVGSMPGGLQRQANLRMLVDRAEAYEKTDFRGVFRFLRFVERMNESETDLAIASTLGEGENVVRIMSVHKSKGLEFPVVILADIDKQFNRQDAQDALLVERHLGFGPYCIPEENFRYPTVARLASAARIMRAGKAEELRVLYVALTRAKEKLILVGKEKKLLKKIDKWCRYLSREKTELPAYTVGGATSWLDWIAMAAVRHLDGEPLRRLAFYVDLFCPLELGRESGWQVNIIPISDIAGFKAEPTAQENLLTVIRQKKPLPDTAAREEVTEILNWKYDFKGLQDIPSKLSVTELKRRFQEETEEPSGVLFHQYSFRRPDFVRQRTRLSRTEYGTVMHTVLQHIDYFRCTADDIRQQLDLMTEKQILLPSEREAVSVSSVKCFLDSEIGERMRKAGHIYRELPFSRLLKVKRFYDKVEDDKAELFSQGIIDLLIEEPDGFVLVDYKTDMDTEPEKVTERYNLQLQLYKEAVEELTGKKVRQCFLYLLQDGSVTEL